MSMLSRRAFLGGLGSAPFTACTCEDNKTSTAPTSPPYARRVDAHLHISRGGTPRAVEIMQGEGIAAGVNLSGGSVGHGLERQLEDAKQYALEIATFTSPHWKHCSSSGYGKVLATQFRKAIELGARGLKIQKVLGLKVTGPDQRLLTVDEPELDALFEAAGELRAPVWIHTGDPLAFWNPPDDANERHDELAAHPDWALFGKAVPTFDELYAQLERRLARHPHTQFVSVHFGNCAEQPARVAASLRQHPNLCIDTAARIPELGRHPADVMVAFFTEFQDRILFGSDLGVGPPPHPLFLGSSGTLPPTDVDRRRFFDATRRYFETSDRDFEHPTPIQGDWHISGLGLPPPILEKLYVANATRLLRLRA
jgi:predicted TIM-barrel fold metal-dependent hydrolase